MYSYHLFYDLYSTSNFPPGHSIWWKQSDASTCCALGRKWYLLHVVWNVRRRTWVLNFSFTAPIAQLILHLEIKSWGKNCCELAEFPLPHSSHTSTVILDLFRLLVTVSHKRFYYWKSHLFHSQYYFVEVYWEIGHLNLTNIFSFKHFYNKFRFALFLLQKFSDHRPCT